MNITWTKEAEELINKAPVFIRPMIKSKVEKAAKEKGLTSIDESLVNEVKEASMK